LPASVDVPSAVRSQKGEHTTPRALRAGGAFAVTAIPTSDVPVSFTCTVFRLHPEKSTRECRTVSPHPVRGETETSSGRLPSYSDTHFFRSARYAFFASCLVRIEAWRTVSPCLHPVRLSGRCRDFLQARYGIGFSIPYRGCVRPTSATYYLSNRQPAFSVLFTRPVCTIREMRSLTFHDVQARFGRIDASRWGLSPRDFTSLHVSRERNTFRSWPLTPLSPLRASRAALSDDLRASHRGLGCLPPPSREGCRPRTTRSAFLR
jgi:hypothetical protein